MDGSDGKDGRNGRNREDGRNGRNREDGGDRRDEAGQRRAVDASAVVVGFARALRAAGVDAAPDRVQAFLGALGVLDPGARSDVYWAGRLTLCGSQDDLERYERVFAAYFGGRPGGSPARSAPPPRTRTVLRGAGTVPRPAARAEDAVPVAVLADSTDVLRHRDFAELTAAERDQLRRLRAAFTLRGEARRTARRHPARRGAVDPRRTVRELLRGGGESRRGCGTGRERTGRAGWCCSWT
ncbi:hypothetical protein HEP87_62510 [Streptomyces sp. S1D4-11]